MLFGGVAGSTVLADTWEWDGSQWTQMADTGPSSRQGHDMTFDSKIKRVVLFGGMNQNNQAFGDTWSWDGTEWTQEQDTGPSARANHKLAYDAVRDRTVLFGGSTIQSYQVDTGSFWTGHHYETHYSYYFLNDTWEWNGSQWSRVADTGPAPRGRHGMGFDGTRVLLFGGQGSAYFGDTWDWDGKHWTQLQDIGPGPRAPAGMAYDSDRGRSVLFGGVSQNVAYLGDTWELYEHPEPD